MAFLEIKPIRTALCDALAAPRSITSSLRSKRRRPAAMRLPDLSRLRLEPRADARGADEEDATGAFAAQVEPQHIDCRADAPLSVRRQLWERFERMARKQGLLSLKKRKPQQQPNAGDAR